MFDHFFSLHENRDGHIAGLMEAKPEEIQFAQIEKMCHFTFYNFVFMANFLSVQSLRRYEILKK